MELTKITKQLKPEELEETKKDEANLATHMKQKIFERQMKFEVGKFEQSMKYEKKIEENRKGHITTQKFSKHRVS